MSWADWLARETASIAAAGRWREPRDFDAGGAEGKLAPDGRAVVAYASNDYLGLTQHPAVVAAAHAALDRWGSGSGAARLIVGSRPVHSELEAALAAWKGTERCVVFPTGFAANLGAITTLGAPDVTIFSDELNHASIIDGARLARAEVTVYPHRDVPALTPMLRARPAGTRALVVTDTVFSMDGDVAPVDDLVDVTRAEEALLLVDEAHAVLGPELPALDHIVRVGTLSKTLGALGGFVAGSADACDLIVNRARSYIFTTAPTPADTAAALAALGIVRSPEGAALRERLRANVDLLRPGHPSPIVPIICGDETRALAASAALLEQGILVPAIRPPTVAPGTCRLRVALSAAHTPEQVTLLRDALGALDLR
ncbi:MAG TPA: 8-amino-7-oxononanoate synthase [Acidimicrobiia bacterium]|jgi:8-amino-7-oxononanoate synthase